MRRTLSSCCAAFVWLLLSTTAAAQSAPPAQSPAGAPAAPAAGAQPAQPVEVPAGWSYDPEGRRDPFQSLLGRGSDPKSAASRPAGIAGLVIGEITVKGIVKDRRGFIATVRSADGKTHFIRAGDQLFDGSVKAIQADRVVFSQDVTDPLSLVKQREITKTVRGADGGSPSLEM